MLNGHLLTQVTKSRYIFLILFFAYLCILPLPLGSNRDWAWSVGQLYIFSLSLSYGLLFWRDIQASIKHHLIPISILLAVILWIFFQWLPLPFSWLSFLSPESAHAYANVSSEFGSLSLDRRATFHELLKLISYLCVFVLTVSIINSPKLITYFLLVVVFNGTFNAAYGSFEILSGQDNSVIFNIENGHRASGTFVYHNHFANFILLSLSAGLGFFIATMSKKNHQTKSKRSYIVSLLVSLIETKSTVRVCLTMMVIALVMSHSRMGNTAFFASLTIISFLYIVLGKQVSKNFKLLVISMIIIDVFVVSAWFGLDKVKDRLEATSIEAENRDEVVIDGLNMLRNFPLTGAGAGSFNNTFVTYQSENIKGKYQHAHNDYLQFGIEYGIPITLVLSLLLTNIACRSLSVIRTSKNKLLAGAAASSLMATLGMLIHMTVDFPLRPPANSSYFILLLAIGSVAYKFHTQQKS